MPAWSPAAAGRAPRTGFGPDRGFSEPVLRLEWRQARYGRSIRIEEASATDLSYGARRVHVRLVGVPHSVGRERQRR